MRLLVCVCLSELFSETAESISMKFGRHGPGLCLFTRHLAAEKLGENLRYSVVDTSFTPKSTKLRPKSKIGKKYPLALSEGDFQHPVLKNVPGIAFHVNLPLHRNVYIFYAV